MATAKKELELFDKDELIESASVFGVMPEIMAGALHTVTDKISKDAAAKKLADFLTRPIKGVK